MISASIDARKDGKSSALAALKYGEGPSLDKNTGELIDKSHRTRLGNFGLVDDGIYAGGANQELIEAAALEMQANCQLNTKVPASKQIEHIVVSFNQDKPSEAVLRDTEDSMLAALKLDSNHFATFLHNDNGFWHLHIFASRIDQDKHICNQLWHSQIERDKVCRQVEKRHGLEPDKGMHRFDEFGKLVEIPKAERILIREAKPKRISGEAKNVENVTGEKTFQQWVTEIRLGDRLKHAKSWTDLHQAAAAYNCIIKKHGNGFVICPIDQKAYIQLSKIGLKGLDKKFGKYTEADKSINVKVEQKYIKEPIFKSDIYPEFTAQKSAFSAFKLSEKKKLKELQTDERKQIEAKHAKDIKAIRANKSVEYTARKDLVSIAKMEQVFELNEHKTKCLNETKALTKLLNEQNPGSKFPEYLVKKANAGDEQALNLARKFGEYYATDVLKFREAEKLKLIAAIRGDELLAAQRLKYSHHVENNGTVVYDFGNGRLITDSAIVKSVQLNASAAASDQAVLIALQFATKKFGSTLTLTGSAEFQKFAIEVAVKNNLNIKFTDPASEKYRLDLREHQINSYKRKASENDRRNRPPDHVLDRARNDLLGAKEPASKRRETTSDNDVHKLSTSDLDDDKSNNVEVLLSDSAHASMGDAQPAPDLYVRRTTTGVGRSAERTNTLTSNTNIDISTDSSARNGAETSHPARTRTGTGTGTGTNGRESGIRIVEADQESDRAETIDVRLTPGTLHSPSNNQEVLHPGEAVSPVLDPELHQSNNSDPGPKTQEVQELAQTAADWIAAQPKPATEPYSNGAPKAKFFVVYVGSDGIVLDHGRTVAKYPLQPSLALEVGEQVVIDRGGELRVARNLEPRENDMGRGY